jgi:flavodoxin
MHAIVVYDSLHGNTERVARAIGEALQPLGDVRVAVTTDIEAGTTADLWVIGGPTHNHGMSRPLMTFVDGLVRADLRGVPVATFDTRYRYHRWLSGSAAHGTANRLQRHGGRLITEPESFFVEEGPRQPDGGKPTPESEHLAAGELERATAWGRHLAELVAGMVAPVA